jgi:heme-degrading monooxygenase HmoA
LTDWHLAQMNVATLRYPLDDPRVADFVNQLDEINALAERSPGFVWRLKGDGGNATDIQVTDDPDFIVNMSVWESAEALFAFVYTSAHRPVMTRRREWFVPPKGPYQVLWWVAAGATPAVQEGLDRLAHLDRHGPSAHAFTFKSRFPPPGRTGGPSDLAPDPYCVGWE